MEYVNFYERIQNIKNIEKLCAIICDKYNIGSLKSFKHIEVGYEDFNIMIVTEKGKYFAKILNKSRPQQEIDRLIKILNISIEKNIKTPSIYKFNNDSICNIEIDKKKLQVILMNYIDGTNMLFMNRDINENEIRQIARQMAKINSIDYDVEEYYDEWTITNFESEYNKKIDKLDENNKRLVMNVYNKIKAIDITKLPKTYIHGDIIKSNLILDKDKNVWVIDFSVLNYLPRIIELAVAMFGICLTNDRKKSITYMNILLNEYNKNNKITNDEIECIPFAFNAISAMNVLQTAYIKNTDESFEENEHWLLEGKKGIKLNLSREDIIIND